MSPNSSCRADLHVLKMVMDIRVQILCVLCAVLAACQPVPFGAERSVTTGAPPSGALAETARPWLESSGSSSGFVALPDGTDALAARLQLIEAAEATIDLQYFLVKPDLVGMLVADRLFDAANRGVRVRLLVDDIFTRVRDEDLATLDFHPNIEVRLFNPVARSAPTWLAFASEFSRTNRRMHNKSMTVDGAATVFGGRNIADEYFEIDHRIHFADFDMLGLGPVAADVSRTFDLFWNSRYSVPLAALSDRSARGTATAEEIRIGLDPRILARAESAYRRAVARDLMGAIEAGTRPVHSGPARVVTDPPHKILAPGGEGCAEVLDALTAMLEAATREVVIVTPYLVPGCAAVEQLQRLRARGVEIVIVTNSLASTNHAYVHGVYRRYRHGMIDAGVRLFEFMPEPPHVLAAGRNRQTLHTKIVLVDRRNVLVTSLNLNARSMFLDTELGVFIESPALAARLAEAIAADLPGNAYSLTLDAEGRLAWIARDGDVLRVWRSEPSASLWQRFIAGLAAILPVEGHL
jgi:cardiolipin synthase C